LQNGMKVFGAQLVAHLMGRSAPHRPPRSQIPPDPDAPGRTGDRNGDGAFSNVDNTMF